MKKTLLILLLAIASAPAVFAQAAPGGATSSKDYTGGATTDSRNTGFGIKGGYNLANFFGSGKDLIPKRDNLNTFHAGAYGQFGFNNFSSVQVELLYSRKGVRYDDGSGLKDLRLDYLALPILYVGNITDNFSFHIGPELALLTKVKEGDNDVDIKSGGYNSFDVSGVAGLEYRLGPARLGARYDLGLARLVNTAGVDRITNQVLQLYVGIGLTQ
ncbi:porin family protein [Hymenobacter daeguensis]